MYATTLDIGSAPLSRSTSEGHALSSGMRSDLTVATSGATRSESRRRRQFKTTSRQGCRGRRGVRGSVGVRSSRLAPLPSSSETATPDVGHAFFHPDNALEPHGEGGWLMVREEGVLGAVVREGNGYYKVFVKRDGMAAPLF